MKKSSEEHKYLFKVVVTLHGPLTSTKKGKWKTLHRGINRVRARKWKVLLWKKGMIVNDFIVLKDCKSYVDLEDLEECIRYHSRDRGKDLELE